MRCRRRRFILTALPALLGLLTVGSSPPGCAAAAAQTLPEFLRSRIEVGGESGDFRVGGERVLAVRALSAFYLQRDYRPAWTTPGGIVGPQVDSLLAVLREAPTHGLGGTGYHAAGSRTLLHRIRGASDVPAADDLAELEILLTDAFLVYGSHLLLGRVNPERVQAEWIANRRKADVVGVLEEGLMAGDLRGALERLAPTRPEYRRLREALAQLEGVRAQHRWDAVDEGGTLREGDAGVRVAQVRRRLLASTDAAERRLAAAPDALGESFTPALTDAVRSFQHRHGLEVDGLVGIRTVAAMNVPVETRIEQVVANLERWRWLSHDLGSRHIRVNIAAFETEVWDTGAVVMRLRSIVGRQYRMTPSFSASMTYLVLAPYWNVPPNIAAEDKLPEIVRDVGYLERMKFALLDAETGEPVDPRSVEWAALTGEEFNRRYHLRQDPGPLNALGEVKFMFPNPHSVYLHDTPDRELFQQTQRDFSSGCIRVEHAMDLAAYLVGSDPQWTPEALRAAVEAGVERTLVLGEPVPVHLLYMTVFVDPEGHVHFRPDLYGRDAVVLGALAAEPPAL